MLIAVHWGNYQTVLLRQNEMILKKTANCPNYKIAFDLSIGKLLSILQLWTCSQCYNNYEIVLIVSILKLFSTLQLLKSFQFYNYEIVLTVAMKKLLSMLQYYEIAFNVITYYEIVLIDANCNYEIGFNVVVMKLFSML